MNALKEWATVVKALENGNQTVLLRKGGILETVSGFKIESKKFLLFPTFEHQELKHIKPDFHNYLEEVNHQCRRRKRHGFNPWLGKIFWRRAWQPTPVFLPGESHGQRSLEGYSSQGHEELDVTETT